MAPSDLLEAAVLDRLAAGWIALGAPLGGDPDPTLVDPEALVVMTSLHGSAEPRILDVALDWCVTLGSLVNGARLRTVAREIGGDSTAVGAFAALVAGAGGPRWPVLDGPPIRTRPRGTARVRDLRQPGALAVRLRALTGVAVRADLLAVLATEPWATPSLADLAARTRTTKRNVAIAVGTLALGGAVEIDRVGNAQRVRLTADPALRAWLGVPPEPADWVTRHTLIERVLRFDAGAIASPVARAVEARVLAERLLPLARRSGLPTPDTTARGEAFGGAYTRWRGDLVVAVRP